MDINEVAKRSGLPASALRFYEEKGLIRSVARRGLRRVFAPEVLDRLALIALARASGFSLDEIGRMFAPDGKPKIDRALLAAKAKELDGTIRQLTAMRDGLRHAAVCPAPSHMECPTFRRLLKGAAACAIGGRGRKKPALRRSLGSDLSRVDSHSIKPHEYKELPEMTDRMLAGARLGQGSRTGSPNPRKAERPGKAR